MYSSYSTCIYPLKSQKIIRLSCLQCSLCSGLSFLSTYVSIQMTSRYLGHFAFFENFTSSGKSYLRSECACRRTSFRQCCLVKKHVRILVQKLAFFNIRTIICGIGTRISFYISYFTSCSKFFVYVLHGQFVSVIKVYTSYHF